MDYSYTDIQANAHQVYSIVFHNFAQSADAEGERGSHFGKQLTSKTFYLAVFN